ncbi:hypothetical protein BJV77DRAFT_1066768 [Russula vinacea]|nr:hypothetical protein BJV77DRAFT_1066768 [Russula vinacea]
MSETLPIDAVARANGNARRDGTFAGLTAGLLGGPPSSLPVHFIYAVSTPLRP